MAGRPFVGAHGHRHAENSIDPIPSATTSNGGLLSAADKVLLDAAAPSASSVLKSLYDAHTVLAATTDNTPAALTVGEDRIVGRIAAGNIAALTAAQAKTLLTIARADLVQETSVYPLSPSGFRRIGLTPLLPLVVGAFATNDLGLNLGTFLTSAASLLTEDLKIAGAKTESVIYYFEVPDSYVAGQNITLRMNAGMVTTVADTAATIDAEVVRLAAPSVDICATAAQSINSLTPADKNFTLTGTNIVVGDTLVLKVTVAVNDGAAVTAVIGSVFLGATGTGFLVSIKG